MTNSVSTAKLCLSGIILASGLATAGSASADWNGTYWGAHLGYGWGKAETKFDPLPSAAIFVNLNPQTLTPKPSGGLLGLQVGRNWQSGSTVTGIEADISYSAMKGTDSRSPFNQYTGSPFPGGRLTAEEKMDWFGTLRGRVGFTTANSSLFYVTGGAAFGNLKVSADSDFRPLGTEHYAAAATKTKWGWTIGAGAEWPLSSTSAVRVEYLYYDLGSVSATANPSIPFPPGAPAFQVKYDWKANGNILRAGLNYKF